MEVLAGRRGQVLGGAGLHVVAIGGATSIGHFLAVLGPCGIGARLGGLCDAGQERHIRRTMARGGLGASASRAGLEALGFYVCTTDLEDELIRAAGTGAVEQIIRAQGELRSFRIFRQQPAQRQRSTAEQLHRFLGTRSGHKSRYARLLAAEIDPARFPARSTACSRTRSRPHVRRATGIRVCAGRVWVSMAAATRQRQNATAPTLDERAGVHA